MFKQSIHFHESPEQHLSHCRALTSVPMIIPQALHIGTAELITFGEEIALAGVSWAFLYGGFFVSLMGMPFGAEDSRLPRTILSTERWCFILKNRLAHQDWWPANRLPACTQIGKQCAVVMDWIRNSSVVDPLLLNLSRVARPVCWLPVKLRQQTLQYLTAKVTAWRSPVAVVQYWLIHDVQRPIINVHNVRCAIILAVTSFQFELRI